MHKRPLRVFRYENYQEIASELSPREDLLNYFRFLGANDYVTELLKRRFGLSSKTARERTKLISPHVDIALQYIAQAHSSAPHVAFLPTYYAALNLAKVTILFSTEHRSLAKQKWHGATYGNIQKNSHSLATERITVKKRGAIPLLYHVLTGKPIPREVSYQMRDVLSRIAPINAEWVQAGETALLADIEFSRLTDGGSHTFEAKVTHPTGETIASVRQLQVLNGWKKKPGTRNVYETIADYEGGNFRKFVTERVRPCLIYRSTGHNVFTPLSGAKVLWPEEFPILLAMFYFGTIVRYNPLSLAKLADSRFWPVALALRDHGMHRFLLLTWARLHGTSLRLRPSVM